MILEDHCLPCLQKVRCLQGQQIVPGAAEDLVVAAQVVEFRIVYDVVLHGEPVDEFGPVLHLDQVQVVHGVERVLQVFVPVLAGSTIHPTNLERHLDHVHCKSC